MAVTAERWGSHVEGPCEVALPPGAAPVIGGGEPGVGGEGGIARPVVPQVVPGNPDRAVRVNGDRGEERERAHAGDLAAAPGAAAIPRSRHGYRARADRAVVFGCHIDGAVGGDSGAGESRPRE